MIVAVSYRIDAHAYDERLGGCRAGCAACVLEDPIYTSEGAAIAAQPAPERAQPDGDQSALDLPPRRFTVVVLQLVP